MQSISAGQLITLWEQGRAEHPIQKALLVLEAAYPEFSRNSLAQYPIGQRDTLLFQIRERLFGQELRSVVTCEQCGEQLEFALHIRDLLGQPEMASSPPLELTLEQDTYEVHFRLPNSQDFLEVTRPGGQGEAHDKLLERCLVQIRNGDSDCTAAGLGQSIRDALMEKMAEADPLADIRVDISCPACGHTWQSVLDVVDYLWNEIEVQVHQTLIDVHLLASTYHWREEDILSMSPWRRQQYLEMIHG